MAKIDINFNNNKYTIDESSLSAASSALKSHLSSVMNGQGATINFDGVTYSIDSTKLTTATNAFVSHLGTISGSGHKVKVNGVEYSVGSDKVVDAVSELDAVLGGLNSGGSSSGKVIEFDGNLEGREYYENTDGAIYVKVSDKTLSFADMNKVMEWLTSEVVVYCSPPVGSDVGIGNDGLNTLTVGDTYAYPYMCNSKGEFGEYDDIMGICLNNVDGFLLMVSINKNDTCPQYPSEPGTYFVYISKNEVVFYTKSISCLTESTPSTPVEPETLEGDGQEFHKFAPTALTFRSTAPLNELQEVQINGVTVDPSNYTLEEGSTIVTLPIDYLKTLDVDNYEITVVSDSKTAKGGFSVVEPELNEHGFYYNQPYSAYLPMFGGDTAFFVREDGTYDIITVGKLPDTGEYTMNGNNIVATHPLLGTITCTISSDGTEVFCNELQTAFKLGYRVFAADEDYIYFFDYNGGGCSVYCCIDNTKTEYAPVKTNINDVPTVAFSDWAFKDSINLAFIPQFPSTITTIRGFEGCNGIKNIIIPNNINEIYTNAFKDCTGLTSVVIPDSITDILSYAFYDCLNLTIINFNGTIAQWNAIIKGNNWNYNVPATYVQCTDGQVPLN